MVLELSSEVSECKPLGVGAQRPHGGLPVQQHRGHRRRGDWGAVPPLRSHAGRGLQTGGCSAERARRGRRRRACSDALHGRGGSGSTASTAMLPRRLRPRRGSRAGRRREDGRIPTFGSRVAPKGGLAGAGVRKVRALRERAERVRRRRCEVRGDPCQCPTNLTSPYRPSVSHPWSSSRAPAAPRLIRLLLSTPGPGAGTSAGGVAAGRSGRKAKRFAWGKPMRTRNPTPPKAAGAAGTGTRTAAESAAYARPLLSSTGAAAAGAYTRPQFQLT
jgi:hypothetical protein